MVVSYKRTCYRAGRNGAGDAGNNGAEDAADFCWGILSSEDNGGASSTSTHVEVLQLWPAGRITLLEDPEGPREVWTEASLDRRACMNSVMAPEAESHSSQSQSPFAAGNQC